MPCGGIYPIPHDDDPGGSGIERCYYCNKAKPIVTHYIEEWDAVIHKDCIDDFLENAPDGQIIVKHGHKVIK